MARPASPKDYNLFFFDSETGGLSPHEADFVEVAAILTDPSGKTVLEEYCTKVIPKKPVNPRAAAVNGYSAEKWAAEAIPLDHAMVKLLSMARNAFMVAHNVQFDWAFLEAAMAERMQRWTGDHRKICTMTLAQPLLLLDRVPNLKLGTLTEYFKVPHEDAHTALSDVRACRGLYLKLMEAYVPALSAIGGSSSA